MNDFKCLINNICKTKIIGYRVEIYQPDKKIWSMKTTGLYSYHDAYTEAEKIHKETGKHTRVQEYWEVVKTVQEFKKENQNGNS